MRDEARPETGPKTGDEKQAQEQRWNPPAPRERNGEANEAVNEAGYEEVHESGNNALYSVKVLLVNQGLQWGLKRDGNGRKEGSREE